jgi:hypothetical protein
MSARSAGAAAPEGDSAAAAPECGGDAACGDPYCPVCRSASAAAGSAAAASAAAGAGGGAAPAALAPYSCLPACECGNAAANWNHCLRCSRVSCDFGPQTEEGWGYCNEEDGWLCPQHAAHAEEEEEEEEEAEEEAGGGPRLCTHTALARAQSGAAEPGSATAISKAL